MPNLKKMYKEYLGKLPEGVDRKKFENLLNRVEKSGDVKLLEELESKLSNLNGDFSKFDAVVKEFDLTLTETSYVKSREITAKNPLPNIENAKIDSRKLTDYALNLEHPVGGNKAKVFESALGYNKLNSNELMNQVYEKLGSNEAILGKLDQFGQRYTVDMQITGPNGKTTTVRTGWILKFNSDIPEMTTIYVK